MAEYCTGDWQNIVKENCKILKKTKGTDKVIAR
jgi:hypothetical protein